MEESLKALRFTHRALLALLAAILLFALSPNRHRTYEKAYSFLEALEAVDEEAYRDWATKIANQHVGSRHQVLERIFEDVANRGGPTVEWQHLENGTIGSHMTFIPTGPRIQRSSIESLNRVFREDLPVKAMNLPIERIASLVRHRLDPNKKYQLDNFTVRGTVGIGRMDIQLYLYDEAGKLQHVMGTETFDRRPVDGHSFHVWLETIGQKDLVSRVDEKGIVFKPLRPIWTFVYTKTIKDAKDWLQQEILRLGDAKVLNVLGISISETQGSIAAPAITLVFMLALVALLEHARRVFSPHDLEILRTFPWIPLFPGTAGLAARVFTILFLPVAANAWLLIRARGTATVVGWFEWIVLVGAAVWAYTEAAKLCKMIAKESQN